MHPPQVDSPSATPVPSAGADRTGVYQMVLLYAVFAGAWILFSDEAVEVLFTDPAQIIRVSMIKGWVFVAVTTALLYGLATRLVGHWLDRELHSGSRS